MAQSVGLRAPGGGARASSVAASSGVGAAAGGVPAAARGVGAMAAGVGWPAITEQTKPWTRWWWQGSAVDRANLTWNMEKYKAAGLGGLELTPIYGVKGYESHFVDYLSPAWMELFGYTLKEAKRLGLGLDMSTGTGWPFGGGPLIDSTYACKELFSRVWTVKGGERLMDTVRFVQEPLVHTDGRSVSIGDLVEPVFANKDLQALALFQVRFARVLPLQALMAYSTSGAVVDLTATVGVDGRLDWTAPVGGDWTLYGMFQGMHGKMVERAAPGAEGNVIDHFSAVALKKYLSRFDTAFVGHSLSPLRCFFNDSYEVDDARGQGNWTPGFFELFLQRRGYDLRQHLPALFGKGDEAGHAKGDEAGLAKGDEAARVLCDYRETISDLLLSEFTRPWADWAHSKGARIRNQAHGSPANILDLYAASDIPETEGGEILRYKFGTSAAHVTGKPLASAETVTWLDEHFLSGYSDVKKALDNYLLGGVNHIFYHGTAYTPKDETWPGWLFYAAVHFTPNDPEWKDFGVLNGYVARCQSFLQQGAPDEDVLLYYPIYDSWMEGGAPGAPGRVGGGDMGKALLKHYDRMDPEFSGTGFKECAELMLSKGYGFDYISDKQILGLRLAEGGGVRTTGGGRYKTVLLPDCRYISLAAMERLVQLADSGVKILVYKKLPGGVPGYGELERRSGAFKGLVSRAGRFVVGDDLTKMLGETRVRREPMVDLGLSFVRRTYGDGHVYFIVNHGTKAFEGNVVLGVGESAAVVYDPMTGAYGVAKGMPSSGVYMQMLPGQSCLVQTLSRVPGGKGFPYYHSAGTALPLVGWKMKFLDGGPVGKSFTGTASYTLSFGRPEFVTVEGAPTAWLLDLGKVKQTAEVFLNGVKVAGLIGPDYRVVIPASGLRALNKLEVIVSSGMLNRIEDMDRRGVVWKKFYNTNFPAHERANRGANGLFDATRLAPEEAGLTGPVSLQPLVMER